MLSKEQTASDSKATYKESTGFSVYIIPAFNIEENELLTNEDEISEWYDIIFAQENLILTEKNAWGYSPIELTQKSFPMCQKLLDQVYNLFQ